MKYEKAVRDGLLAVFYRATEILMNGSVPKVVPAGSIFRLKSVSVLERGRLKLCTVKGVNFAVVKTVDVRLYSGRLPDWRMEVYLDKIGWQSELYHGTDCRDIQCRDHGGSPSARRRLAALDRLSADALKEFHRLF